MGGMQPAPGGFGARALDMVGPPWWDTGKQSWSPTASVGTGTGPAAVESDSSFSGCGMWLLSRVTRAAPGWGASDFHNGEFS